MIDGVSATLKAFAFIALFQAAGMAMSLSIFRSLIASPEHRWLRNAIRGTAVGAVFLVGLHFIFESARMGGSIASIADPSLQHIALASSAGTALGWKLAGLLLICTGTLRATTAGRAVSLLGAGVLIAGFTRTGHTSVGGWHFLPGVLLWIHLAIVAFWFGALVPLYRASRSAYGEASALVEGFSRIAVWLVPLVFLAGLSIAVLLIGSLRGFLTPYGAIIAAKALVFGILMLLAALNRWRFAPGLAAGSAVAASGLRRGVAAEFILISFVITLTSALTTWFSPES